MTQLHYPQPSPSTNNLDSSPHPSSTPHPPPSLPLRLVTHNIRYAASPSQRLPHEPPWPTRLPQLLSQFRFLTRLPFAPSHSIICLQEVLTAQIHDLARGMGDEWNWVGLGRDDGRDDGERCVIMFQTKFWRKVHFETVWLNETGQVGKRGWDAGSVRVVSCLVLDVLTASQTEKENEKGRRVRKRMLIMNTHLDNAGPVARRESAKILLNLADRFRSNYGIGSHAIIGDLNSEVDGEAYAIVNGPESGVKDALQCVAEDERKKTLYGETKTYTGFDGKGDEDERLQRIDFVFVQSGQGSHADDQVEGYSVLPNVWEDSKVGRMSDHRAVCVDLLI